MDQIKEKTREAARRAELLAPAGDLEKLKSALHFGADAVYLGGPAFGLRKASKNFSLEDLEAGVQLAHQAGKKIYVTLNIIPHNRDLVGLEDYVDFLDRVQVDGVIVSDAGIFTLVKNRTQIPIHISTQTSITNSKTVNFWHQLGASRVILARELSLEEIRQIRQEVPEDMELETFVHGAMCISYSGRCLLSNYMTGRDANQGDCAQACRWKYRLVEEKRPGEYYPITENEDGTFIFNSKDLCLLEDLPALLDAGVHSLKLEGRVKSQFYVSTVVKTYREALDAIADGTFDQELVDRLLEEVKKTSHRSFTKGFLYGRPGAEGQNYESSSYVQGYDFLGLVKEYDPAKGMALVEERNKFKPGDRVELMTRKPGFLSFDLEAIYNEEGEAVDEANVPMDLFWIPVHQAVEPGDLVRKAKISE